MAWLGKWAGGRVRAGGDGALVWVIERMVARVPYSITLDVASEREALAELALFERDPGAYRTKTRAAAEADGEAAKVTADDAGLFLAYLKEQGRTHRYRIDIKNRMAWWIEKLGGRDLRKLELRDLTRILDHATDRKGKIIAIKSYCSWLRERGDLRRQDDPTLDLTVPTSVPEKEVRQKGHSMDVARRVYRALDDQTTRDVCRLKWSTAMHLTEVDRLVVMGEIRELEGYGPIAGVLVFWHKKNKRHLQSVGADVIAAARRLMARGAVPGQHFLAERIEAAAKAARVEVPALGEMRHSFVAWSKDHGEKVMPAKGGLPLSDIAAAIGHTSDRTTSRFYDVTTAPPMVWVPDLRLFHPDDPLAVALSPRRGGGRT